MADGSNGNPIVTTATAARTVHEIFGVLPGPPPLVWGSQPRSALVVAAHPGDAAVGFGIGLHALAAAGWRATLVSVFDDVGPRDPRRWAALEDVLRRLGPGPQAVQHLSLRDRPDVDRVAQLLAARHDDQDLVIGPAVGGGSHADHELVGRAVKRGFGVGQVYRYLMPGQRVAADTRTARRASVPAGGVLALQRARLRLMGQLACVASPVSAWPATSGMMTASDPVLV